MALGYGLTRNALMRVTSGWLEGGSRVNEFLAWCSGVSREQVEAVLEHAERSLAAA
jgi:hypothetical protein